MEKIILIVLTALGTMGEKYAHLGFDALEAFCIKTETMIDNNVFYKAMSYAKTWEPKHPPEE